MPVKRGPGWEDRIGSQIRRARTGGLEEEYQIRSASKKRTRMGRSNRKSQNKNKGNEAQ